MVQCLSCAGFLHASYHAAAAVHLGIENSKGDDAATVAEVDRNLAIAAHQLLKSIDNYVKSDAFNPTVELDESFMETILKKNNKKSNKTK